MFGNQSTMYRLRLLFFICFLRASAADNDSSENSIVNNRPIIGILSQELSPTLQAKFGNHSSYIAASYVKYLEGAGARVVPIMIGQSRGYYANITREVNGVLFPGGATYFDNPNGYADAGYELYQLALELNAAGDYFPIWGTCLGFELLTYVAADRQEHRTSCSFSNKTLPVTFEKDYKDSHMFKHLPQNLAAIMSTRNVTAHFHGWCVTEANLTALGIMKDWKVLATDKSASGEEFISVIESRQYPFYGTIFHPEKNGYEWLARQVTPHDKYSIVVMDYFANFFVNEARKNTHVFRTEAEEEDFLIYKYQPTYTGNQTIYEQAYFFDL